jgi:hypothetical protein
MPVPPEVDPLQGKVGRDQYVLFLLASAWQKSQHGAVVSNSSHNRRPRRGRRLPANLSNQRFFGNHHDTTICEAQLRMLPIVPKIQEAT